MPLYNPAGGGALRQVAPGAYNPGGSGTAVNALSGAVAGTFGAWVQIAAALASNDILYGISVGYAGATAGTHGATIQIGVGGAGAEVVQLGVSFHWRYNTNAGYMAGSYVPLPYPLKIPAGSRIAIRIADTVASAEGYSIALTNVPQSAVVAY